MENTQEAGFGLRLRGERKRVGLTQSELASAGGVSTSSQGAYEAETHKPDIAYLTAIAAVGIDVTYVVLGAPGKITSEAINWPILLQIVDLIDRWVATQPLPPPPGMRAHFAKVFYEQFLADQTFAPEKFEISIKRVG